MMISPKFENIIYDVSMITDYDICLFKEGKHFRLYEKLGSHLMTVNNVRGVHFAVWAPNAERISVIGDFNRWNTEIHPLMARSDDSGIWEGFIPWMDHGAFYKYHIVSKYRDFKVDKGDPFCFYWQRPPKTASVVWDLNYSWNDAEWMKKRGSLNSHNAPISIYEVHLGSWKRKPEEENRLLTYHEIATCLAGYVKEMGFTHVEFLPVMEHPFYGSWGYETTGYFAPTSRYGSPQDFMYLIDYLHQNGIGVILDWVPSHFPDDEHGLVYFDGTHLYEHQDPRKGYHPEWHSYIFNYGRHEVCSFLISSALFWLDKYHADGLRTDAVASMLYLDYGRKEGEWIPNERGGNENIEAVAFLRRLNEAVYGEYPTVQTMAEESTSWPMVSRPVYLGGLGFGMKWNMGWMHDTLHYFSNDQIFRKYNHKKLTFSIWYAFYENFILSLSHDEVVYGKRSLIGKMPGDEWQKFANLRLLYGYMYMHPGKKLLFMGDEFGQWSEWYHEEGLHWHLLEYPMHKGLKRWLQCLNQLLSNEPSLYERDFEPGGFEWIDLSDSEKIVISFLRKGRTMEDITLAVCNFMPVVRYNYTIGVTESGFWKEVLNSDAREYGGSGQGNLGGVEATITPHHGRQNSLSLTLPPLGIIVLKRTKD